MPCPLHPICYHDFIFCFLNGICHCSHITLSMNKPKDEIKSQNYIYNQLFIAANAAIWYQTKLAFNLSWMQPVSCSRTICVWVCIYTHHFAVQCDLTGAKDPLAFLAAIITEYVLQWTIDYYISGCQPGFIYSEKGWGTTLMFLWKRGVI